MSGWGKGPFLAARMLWADECRQDVYSSETWNGGAGTITFNWLQQHEEGFDPSAVPSPIEEGDGGTTNPWNI